MLEFYSHHYKYPSYDYCFFIYDNNDLVGFTHTELEADIICLKYPQYTWNYSQLDNDKLIKKYLSLPQLKYINNK